MSKRRYGSLFNTACLLAAAAALSACSHAEAVMTQPVPATAATTAAPSSAGVPNLNAAAPAPAAPAAPMTREKASTDCWMKYEKEARGLSLDQRLPLVEKCTADKLKAAAR